MNLKLKIISIIIISSAFIFVSCDKPTMYAVSNYSIHEFLKRYEQAVEKFGGGSMKKNDKKYIYSAFAGSQNDWKSFEKKLNTGPKDLPVLYAFSNYSLNRYSLRFKEAEKNNLEQYARKAIPESGMTVDATEHFYAASRHNISTFKKRIKDAVRQGMSKDDKILCFAMSEHSIDTFIKRYTDGEKHLEQQTDITELTGE